MIIVTKLTEGYGRLVVIQVVGGTVHRGRNHHNTALIHRVVRLHANSLSMKIPDILLLASCCSALIHWDIAMVGY